MAQEGSSDLTLEGLVHDLNNVFETLTEAADLLAQDSKYSRLAATIHRGVRRGSRILGSYLESSLALLEFDQILDNSIEFVSDFLQAVKRRHIDIRRDVEPGVRLRGNPVAWERVLVNLLLNAAQAMEEGGTVDVAARRVEDNIEILVADEGPGIPTKNLARIFEPHFSTKSLRRGLGLHIVRTLVHQYGGQVTADNRDAGQGAVFRILLPMD